MLDQIFINVGHLYKFPPQNMQVYKHRQAVDMAAKYSILGNLKALSSFSAGKSRRGWVRVSGVDI